MWPPVRRLRISALIPTRSARAWPVRAATWAVVALLLVPHGLPAQQSPPRVESGAAVRPPKLPVLPKTPRVPSTFDELFAYRDARAGAALEYLRCLQGTVNALRSGALGAVPREWSMTCVQQGAEWRGVFGELMESAPGIRVRLQYALRGAGVVTTDRVDTARVNGTARALLRGLAAPLARARPVEFVPIALPQAGFVEVWFVPLPGSPARVVVGGDSLIQMSSDGARELGHSRVTTPVREFAIVPVEDRYTLESREERVPLLSELVIARMAMDLVSEVHVRTRQYDSMISRKTPIWIHTRR